MKKISICIPTADINDGVNMLNNLLESIQNQTFSDYDIIISDHSITDNVKNILSNWVDLDIKYYKNTEGIGSPAMNLNNAISKANGEYIKIMFQDDFFCDNNSLEYLFDNLGEYKFGFLGSYCCDENNTTNLIRPLSPSWISDESVLKGINTMGGPTVMFFKNEDNYFDENLCWLNDTEFYYRLFTKYGKPLCLPNKCVVQRLRDTGLSSTIPNELREEEYIYVINKHINGSTDIDNLPNIIKRVKKLKNG